MALKNQLNFVGGLAAGAFGMYLLDPHRGAYRRAVIHDKSVHFRKLLGKKTKVVGRDLLHRGKGVLAEARVRVLPKSVPDDILVARVAAKLGRIVSNPHAIELTSENGKVFLAGPIYTDEVEKLIHVVEAIPGVRGIQNQLDPHARSEKFPGLQGHRHLKGQRLDILQTNWAPATRFLVTLGSGLIALSTGALAMKKSKVA